MRSFVIYSFKNKISIYEEIDESLEVLKNRGEKEQEYKPDIFWSWWKNKVEYDNEEVSFLVVTDNEKFTIPNDIVIANISQLSEDVMNDVLQTAPKGCEILTFPKIENLQIVYQELEEPKEEEIEMPISLTEPSLANYFRKKTNEMRG